MMKDKTTFRYFVYSMEILLLFVLFSTPSFLPEIFNAKPCLLLSLAITIAVFESEVPAMVFGLVCGALTDLGFSNTIGTFAVSLTIVCFVLGFVANNYIGANFWNVMLSTVVIVTALLSLNFIFTYVMQGYDYGGSYYLSHYIPRIVLTILSTAVLYFFNRFIYRTLCD